MPDRTVAARKRSDLVAVSADGHRAPASAVGAGSIVKKQPAARIGTEPQTRPWTFGDDFGGRTRDGGKQPLQAAFAGNKLNLPILVRRNQFIVTFGDAEEFVNRLDPLMLDSLPVQNRIKRLAEGIGEPLGSSQQRFSRLRVGALERQKFAAAFGGYDPS